MIRCVVAQYRGCLVLYTKQTSISREICPSPAFLFLPNQIKNELLGGTSRTYQGKFSEDGATEIVHNNRRDANLNDIEELVDEAYENINAELVDNQYLYDQIENDETVTASYNEDATEKEDSQNSNSKKNKPDNEIAGSIGYFNEKQRMVFNVVHNWFKIIIKSFSTKRSFTVDPILMFLSGSGRTVKVNKSVYIA